MRGKRRKSRRWNKKIFASKNHGKTSFSPSLSPSPFPPLILSSHTPSFFFFLLPLFLSPPPAATGRHWMAAPRCCGEGQATARAPTCLSLLFLLGSSLLTARSLVHHPAFHRDIALSITFFRSSSYSGEQEATMDVHALAWGAPAAIEHCRHCFPFPALRKKTHACSEGILHPPLCPPFLAPVIAPSACLSLATHIALAAPIALAARLRCSKLACPLANISASNSTPSDRARAQKEAASLVALARILDCPPRFANLQRHHRLPHSFFSPG